MLPLSQLLGLGVLLTQFAMFAAGLPFTVDLGKDPVKQPSSTFSLGQLNTRSDTRRTVIGGHGVVLLPGDSPAETNGQEMQRITVGGSTYQVVEGVDTTIDGVTVKDYVPVDNGNGEEGQAGTMSPGKAAAVAFAEAAERIQRQRGQETS